MSDNRSGGNDTDENTAAESSADPTIPETGDDTSQNTPDRPEEPTAAALRNQDGWSVEGSAARVHYSGATDRYSIEYYAPSSCTIYWKVPPAESEEETAVPVGRDTVPTPLRERIRADLDAVGIDPAVERRTL